MRSRSAFRSRSLFGAAIEWLFIRHLYARDHLQQVLLTFGLILIFNELQRIVWGTRPHSIPIPSYLAGSVPLSDVLSYPVYRIAVAGDLRRCWRSR